MKADSGFSPLTYRFSDALELAAEIHREQRRKKTSIPYIAHVLGVAAIALEHGANEDEAIAALLHDAVEDAPEALGPDAPDVVRRQIAWRFGGNVLKIVNACTDADTRDAKAKRPPWTARKIQYVSTIRRKSRGAVLVSLADKLHNARAILRDYIAVRERLWKRFNKEAGTHGTVGYYRGLVQAFQRRAGSLGDARLLSLVKELNEVVTTIERKAGFTGVWPPAPVKAGRDRRIKKR